MVGLERASDDDEELTVTFGNESRQFRDCTPKSGTFPILKRGWPLPWDRDETRSNRHSAEELTVARERTKVHEREESSTRASLRGGDDEELTVRRGSHGVPVQHGSSTLYRYTVDPRRTGTTWVRIHDVPVQRG